MAVRIAPIGSDLFVEWHHYVLPPKQFAIGQFIFLYWLFGCVLGSVIFLGSGATDESGPAAAIFGGILGAILAAVIASRHRTERLKGFQSQDSTAFQLAVQASLEEAIDLAGISKELVEEHRVI